MGEKGGFILHQCLSNSDIFTVDGHRLPADYQHCNNIITACVLLSHAWSVSLCLADLSPLKITNGDPWEKNPNSKVLDVVREQTEWAWWSQNEYLPPPHPPDALPLGTCLWIPTGLPWRSLQRLQTLGHYREQGQVANLHNTHIMELE